MLFIKAVQSISLVALAASVSVGVEGISGGRVDVVVIVIVIVMPIITSMTMTRRLEVSQNMEESITFLCVEYKIT